MGGDHGLRVSLPAAIASLQQIPHLHLVLVGAQLAVQAELDRLHFSSERVRIVDAEQVVEMTERAGSALRHKPRSSMRLAIDLLADGGVDGVVSAGNTGALMAIGAVRLKTLPGIERPAICAPVPTAKGSCLLLDLGANVDCSAAQLHQFAHMGAALAQLDWPASSTVKPRVALLNIGAEIHKGNEQVKQAAALLSLDATLNYCGFVEGDSLFAGDLDVVVCDGFAGNIALKVCEGTAHLIASKLRSHLSANFITRCFALLAKPALRALYNELDPQRYNGACLLGLRGIVVKSHGGASQLGFERAIARAVAAVERNLLDAIVQRLQLPVT